MKIGEMMTREVTVCRLDETLETAANLFWSRDVGVLPIIDSRVRVVGLLTDRDICLSAMFRARALREIPVGETMSETVVSCTVDDTLETAATKMAEAKVRRLVVLDSEGRLEGIVGLSDLVRVTTTEKLTLKSAAVVLNAINAINTPHGAEQGAKTTAVEAPAEAESVKTSAAKAATPKTATPKAAESVKAAAPKASKTQSAPKAKAATKTATRTKVAEPETLVVPKAAAPKAAAAPKKKAAKTPSKPAAKAKPAKAKSKAKPQAKPGKSARKS